eukprot:403367638
MSRYATSSVGGANSGHSNLFTSNFGPGFDSSKIKKRQSRHGSKILSAGYDINSLVPINKASQESVSFPNISAPKGKSFLFPGQQQQKTPKSSFIESTGNYENNNLDAKNQEDFIIVSKPPRKNTKQYLQVQQEIIDRKSKNLQLGSNTDLHNFRPESTRQNDEESYNVHSGGEDTGKNKFNNKLHEPLNPKMLDDIFRDDNKNGPKQYRCQSVMKGDQSERQIQDLSNEEFDLEDVDKEILREDNHLDVRISNQYYNKIIVSEYATVFFATFGMILSVFLFEMKDDRNIRTTRDSILSYNVFCTVGSMLSIYMRYDLYLQWNTSRGLLSEYDTLWNTGRYKGLILEVLLVVIAPYPGLYDVYYVEYNKQFNTYITYDVNDFLLFFSFIRIYFLARFCMVITQFMNPRSLRVCLSQGCQADAVFATKALMKQKPYTILCMSLVISTVIFAYQLKIFDGPISKASGQNLNSFMNCIWLTIVTLGTIGFGDMYPKTIMGRIVGIIVSFWGVFIVSFFVVTLNNMLTFSANEEKAYNLLLRLYYKGELKNRATLVLGSAFRQRNAHINNPEHHKKVLQAMRIFRMHMINFQSTARMVRAFYEADTDVEIMQKLIEKLMEDVNDLKAKHYKIQNTIVLISEYLDKKLGIQSASALDEGSSYYHGQSNRGQQEFDKSQQQNNQYLKPLYNYGRMLEDIKDISSSESSSSSSNNNQVNSNIETSQQKQQSQQKRHQEEFDALVDEIDMSQSNNNSNISH